MQIPLHGFRPGRSCTAALATAHAAWLKAAKEGKVIGIMAFDLSSAFDTVDSAQLLPKLEALGISDTPLAWFRSYLADGKQCVDWNGCKSSMINVDFGVKQGSILGPDLYLCLVSDFPACLGIYDEDNSCFADDTCLWAIGDSIAAVNSLLNARADVFFRYATSNGLVLNAGKTQLMVGGCKATDLAAADFSIKVDSSVIRPSGELELLGVRFDRTLSTAPHGVNVARAAKQRAGLVARLAHHLPKGHYLTQLAGGLVVGKISYAAAAVTAPRLLNTESKLPSASHTTVQVALNDTARTISGMKRSDHVRIPDLLNRAGLPSYNAIAVQATAMECWKASNSTSGDLVNRLVFPAMLPRKVTRSNRAGIPNPLHGSSTFVAHAALLWEASPELRAAKTKHAAKKAARNLAKSAPI